MLSRSNLCNEYAIPGTLKEALDKLAGNHGESEIIAGGTDVVLSIKEGRKKAPEVLIDISRVPELRSISADGDLITIGACATISEIMQSDVLNRRASILASAAGHVAGRQIRNVATIGGNVCNASPAADMVPALIVLDASAIIVNCEGKQREMPLGNFLLGVRKVDLKPEELLAGFKFRPPGEHTRTSFRKIQARRAMAISILNQAIYLEFEREVMRAVRICMGSVAPTAVRLAHVEDYLSGMAVENVDRERVREALLKDIKPISDFRGSSDYRIKVAERLLIHEVSQLMERQK